MIVFIDTEVNPQTKKVADYGAVREDGAILHTHSKTDFDAFVSRCNTVCGHNIIRHDLKYTALRGNPTIVDTLFLSPLLFPKRPYHHLVKDDKLQVDELNNPVNDSMKARDLLNDEIAAWNKLTSDRQEIYYQLLHQTVEFEGFFKHINYAPSTQQSFLGRILNTQPDWLKLIPKEFEGKVCSHADFGMLVKQYPIELAYCLAVIGADDVFSITPAWVLHIYPQVVNVMNLLCNTSCGECEYCRQRLDAHRLINAGADALICHHTHTLQTIEHYKGRDIYYSIGNFIFDQQKPINTKACMVKVEVTKDQIKTTPIPIVITKCKPHLLR